MPCAISECEVQVVESCSQIHMNRIPCVDCEQGNCSGACFDRCLVYSGGNIPNYSCDFLRYAYVLKYFYVHKAEIRKLFDVEGDEIKDHLSLRRRDSKLVFAAIGAGPGSDLAGFLEWMYREVQNRSFPLRFIRVDKEDSWVNQYNVVRTAYDPLITEMGVAIDYRKVIQDVFDRMPHLAPIDILSFSYIISEIGEHGRTRIVNAIFDTILSSVKEKSVIVLNDRPEASVANTMSYIFELIQDKYPLSFFHAHQFVSDYSSTLSFGNIRTDKWCESHYPDALAARYQPKLKCNSCQMIIYVDKG